MVLLERSLTEAEQAGKLWADDLKRAQENGYSIVRMKNKSFVVVWFNQILDGTGEYSHFRGQQVYAGPLFDDCLQWVLESIGAKRVRPASPPFVPSPNPVAQTLF